MKFAICFLIAVSFSGSLRAQAAWQDQGESDIGLAAQNETAPVKQLDLLRKWEQQYPNSAFKNPRTLLTANALLNIVNAAFGKTDPASLDTGQKAARQLLDGFDTYFGPSVKPATVSDAQWAAIKQTAALQAHALLAQIAGVKKDDATAEAEYKKILAIDPTQASASYQLGSTIIHEMAVSKDLSRYSEAIYDLARSLAVTGPNALPPAGKTTAMNYLKKNYSNYHGDESGLDDLIRQTASSALPPDGFQILSVIQVAAIKADEHTNWAKQHPELDLWQTIKSELESQGDAYFTGNLKDVALPPSGMFSATVVSAPSSKELLVNIDSPAGDARLKFDENIRGDIPAGTAIRFKGVVDSYTTAPSYVLTLNVQDPKTDIAGLPDDVTFVPDSPGRRGKAPSRSAKTTAR